MLKLLLCVSDGDWGEGEVVVHMICKNGDVNVSKTGHWAAAWKDPSGDL